MIKEQVISSGIQSINKLEAYRMEKNYWYQTVLN